MTSPEAAVMTGLNTVELNSCSAIQYSASGHHTMLALLCHSCNGDCACWTLKDQTGENLMVSGQHYCMGVATLSKLCNDLSGVQTGVWPGVSYRTNTSAIFLLW